jgi:hypothetical protein
MVKWLKCVLYLGKLSLSITFLRCGPQHGKIIDVVAHAAGKWSALLATTHKNG